MTVENYCSIDHKFLIRGHTYLPNDRDFAQIEKQKPTSQVNLPKDWIPYIQNGKRKNPFSVISMTDYKTFSSQNFKQLKKTTSKETVRFRAMVNHLKKRSSPTVMKCGFVILWMFQNHVRN